MKYEIEILKGDNKGVRLISHNCLEGEYWCDAGGDDFSILQTECKLIREIPDDDLLTKE